tara:strand:+ start:5064 stop:6437 length:1374 start_codon:yes stop_codon:yes gene_type:complete
MSNSPPTINLEIVPSNVASNGTISYKNGNPIIQFIIGEQQRAILGRSVRLVGKYRVRKDTGSAAGSYVSLDDVTAQSNRLGIYSVIDQLVIKSQMTHQTIEHIKHYNKFCSSFIPVLNSLKDGLGHLSETALIMPSYRCFKKSVLAVPSQRGSGNSFCAHLPCGLFNGVQAVPLAATKGLLIEIHLAPDNNVLYTQDGSVGLQNAYYEMEDVRLVAEATAMDSDTSGTFEYKSVSSYYTSINSSNAIINFNLGLSRVLGAFMTFLPAQNINNLRQDGMSTAPLVGGTNRYLDSDSSTSSVANINQAVFMKGGQRFPLEYNLDTLQKDPPNIIVGNNNQNDSVDPALQRNYLDAVRSFSQIGRSMASTNNTFLGVPIGSLSQDGLVGGFDKSVAEGGSVYGVGVNYDSISDEGQDFSSENFGIQLETGITQDVPHAVYLFIHAKNTLVFNNGGVQVVS